MGRPLPNPSPGFFLPSFAVPDTYPLGASLEEPVRSTELWEAELWGAELWAREAATWARTEIPQLLSKEELMRT